MCFQQIIYLKPPAQASLMILKHGKVFWHFTPFCGMVRFLLYVIESAFIHKMWWKSFYFSYCCEIEKIPTQFTIISWKFILLIKGARYWFLLEICWSFRWSLPFCRIVGIILVDTFLIIAGKGSCTLPVSKKK